MELKLETETLVWRAGEESRVRVVVLNNGYEPIVLDRRLLIGPNPAPEVLSGLPHPVAVEPSSQGRDELTLNPWCLYGRERTFNLPAGRVTFHGYLLRRSTHALRPEGPADPEALLLAADPLVVTVEDGGP
jgi:hypothetical protein